MKRMHLLVGVLPAALGRNARDGALDDLEQGLLDTFAGDVPGDGDVLALLGDLVDLVDEDDAPLGLLDVVVGGLDQLQKDVLDILADVSRLGEGCGVSDRERHVELLGERACKQRLSRSGRADKENVGLVDLDSALGDPGGELDSLVVVVDRDREDLLGLLLTDHVVVEVFLDLLGGGDVTQLTGVIRRA